MLTSYPVLDSSFSNLFCPSVNHSPSPWPVCPFWWTAANFCSIKGKKQLKMSLDPEDDLRRLRENEVKLKQSGYYYGSLSWLDASHLLKKTEVGTFLVRDSEHTGYLYSLSIRTSRGPTSVRIDYAKGRFSLDASNELVDLMPRFESVTDLVDYYVELSKNLQNTESVLNPVWINEESKVDVPVQMYKPLYKGIHSLKHICRLSLIRTHRQQHPFLPITKTVEHTGLPTALKEYLLEYPHPQ